MMLISTPNKTALYVKLMPAQTVFIPMNRATSESVTFF